MKNTMAVCELSRQLKLVCERIESLSMGLEQFEQGNTEMADTYIALRLDELEHAQVLTLNLTDLITQEGDETIEVNTDDGGSVFSAGELTEEKPVEQPEENADCDDLE